MIDSRCGRVLVMFAVSLASSPALAQAPRDGDDPQAAIALGRDAKQRYDQGDWIGALELFDAAEAKAHSPVLLLYIARCERNLGHLVRARDVYARIDRESLAADAPDPFVAARADAHKDLEALIPRLPVVSIDAAGLPAEVAIDIDGVIVSRDRPRLEVDPGPHVAHARAGDRDVAQVAFRAEEGKPLSVRLWSVATGSSGHAHEPSAGPGILGVGLGAAGLVAGLVTRLVAFHEVADVRSRCIDMHCLIGDEGEISTAETLQTVSTVALVAGGVLAAGGAFLLVTRARRPTAAIRVAPAGVAIVAVF